MMLERHYDEESLIAMLHAGDASVSSDPHLSGCTSCADMLESYRVISEVLGGKIVWEPQEMPNEAGAARGVAAIRAFASSMESEDESAVVLVNELLSSPRQWWVATVERDERYHTAGVVRRLVEVSELRIKTSPTEALELAAAAIAVGFKLPSVQNVLMLRGSAFRQYAYSQFYVGNFAAALDAVEEGQGALEQCTTSDYALARLNIVRALIYRAQDRHGDARVLARRSADVFRAFGDRQRLASALATEAYLLMHTHKWAAALAILEEIQRDFKSEVDVDTLARTISNIGQCQQHVGRLPEAVQNHQVAAVLFAEAGNDVEAARLRYAVAALLAEQGHHRDAKSRLREAHSEFTRLGMVHTAVVASLELVEMELLDSNFHEVENLCRAAIRQFESAGVAHSSEALTALTFLREAAEQRRATQEIVWHVRTYIKRLPDEPALLFAPAPLPPS